MDSSQSVVTFENIPTEIHLLIVSFLDAPDIMSIRQTCQRMSCITVDRSIWLSQYQSYSTRFPIPYSPRYLLDDNRTSEVTGPRLESLVLSTHVAETRWLTERGTPRLLYTGNKAMEIVDTGFFGTLLSIDIMLGRWLVAVHQEGMIMLWDLLPTAQGLDNDFGVGFRWTDGQSAIPRCRFKTELQGIGSCTSSVVCMDTDQTAILLAVSSPKVTRLVRLNLTPGAAPIDSMVTLPNPNATYKVAAICPSSQTILFSQPSKLRCLRWSSCSFWEVVLSEEAEEELWNGLVGIKYLTSTHVLCMKTRSVELHMLPPNHTHPAPSTSSEQPILDTQVVRHRFGEMTFRSVSFSDPEVVESPEGTAVTVAFLASDVLRGLFHYEVTASLPRPASDAAPSSPNTPRPQAPPPMEMEMSVHLVAAHKMAQRVDAALLLGMGTGTDTPTPRTMFSAGARGFVSACVLGPQGRRGVWIERQRGNMDRTVFGFSRARDAGARGEPDGAGDAERALKGTNLHEVRDSYDLGEDLTHCAFSELTGRIVIGNRRGQLYVL